MSLAPGMEYVKTERGHVYVRGSAFTDWSQNAFAPSEARSIAAMLTGAADRLDGKLSTSARTMVPLTLQRDEAEALVSVLYRVGGDPDESPRGKTQAVYDRLKAAGVKRPPYKFELVAGGLWFKNYDGKGASPEVVACAELFRSLLGRD